MATIVPVVKHLSKPAAIEIAVAPFDSFRQSILSATIPSMEGFAALEASFKPSADILAALQFKPSAADLEAILGRANYFAELTQGTAALAQVDWRDAPLVPSRPKPRAVVRIERERPLTRGELESMLEGMLEGRDAHLLAQIQGLLQGGTQHGGIVAAGALPARPPMPGSDGYTLDDVFDWFLRVPKYLCFTVEELAPMVGLSPGYLRRKFMEYKAQYGRSPMPAGKSRFI